MKSEVVGRPTRLATVVDEAPSRVMVVLRGLFDCMTYMVIPDPEMIGEWRLGLGEGVQAYL